MVDSYNAPKLEKPAALRDWFSKLNWDILTWKVYVGDAVEVGFDWLLLAINLGFNQVANNFSVLVAWSWQVADWMKYIKNLLQGLINFVYQELASRVTTLIAWVGYLDARITDVLNTAVLPLWNKVDALAQRVTETMVWVSTFATWTLPQLITYNWFTSWWGHGYSSHDSWWAAERARLVEQFEVEVKPVREEVTRHYNLFTAVWDFFADPAKFLYNITTEIVVRFF